jgi:PHD-finger
MSLDHLYRGLPKVPASANLPKKPDPQSTPRDSTQRQSFEPSNARKNLWMDAQGDTLAQGPDTPKTPHLPSLSSTTKDILARVQSERSTLAANGPPIRYFRDVNPLAGLLPPSIGSGSGKSTGLPSGTPTSNNSPTVLNLIVQNTSALDTSKFTGGGSTTDSDPYREVLNYYNKVQTSIPPKLTGQAPSELKPSSSESTIQVASTTHHHGSMDPAPTSIKPTLSSSRRQREYVLPDGKIVPGKGLGRGRPGIKRGPRKPKLNAASSEPSIVNNAVVSSGPGKKRKRSTLTEDEERTETRVSLSDDADSDNYTPKATHTRSGRHTQKPSTFVPIDTPTPKKPRLATEISNAQGKNPVFKKKVYRGKEQNALCELCHRGRGTVENAIVFCDGCNLCWHQECHEPRIPKELVLDKTAQWFCKACAVVIDQTVKELDTAERQSVESGLEAVNIIAEAVPPSSGQPVLPGDIVVGPAVTSSALLVGARSLTLEERQKYLTSLSRQQLLDLLLHASNIAPDLPIFPAPASQSLVGITSNATSKPTSTPTPAPTTKITSQPVTTAGPSAGPSTTTNTMKPPPPPPPPLAMSSNPNLNPSRAAKAAAPKYTSPPSPSSDSADDSDHEEDYDEEDYGSLHSKCYPKPGQGLMSRLPPDEADEHMLLEGRESRTFSHSLRGQGALRPQNNGLGEENKENWIHEESRTRIR